MPTRAKGRKISALVDGEGLPMRVVVHSAEIRDRDGAGLVPDRILRRFPWLELIWADGGSNARQVDAAVAKVPLLRLEIVKWSNDIKGQGFRELAETLATFVTLASIQLALKRVPGRRS